MSGYAGAALPNTTPNEAEAIRIRRATYRAGCKMAGEVLTKLAEEGQERLGIYRLTHPTLIRAMQVACTGSLSLTRTFGTDRWALLVSTRSLDLASGSACVVGQLASSIDGRWHGYMDGINELNGHNGFVQVPGSRVVTNDRLFRVGWTSVNGFDSGMDGVDYPALTACWKFIIESIQEGYGTSAEVSKLRSKLRKLLTRARNRRTAARTAA